MLSRKTDFMHISRLDNAHPAITLAWTRDAIRQM